MDGAAGILIKLGVRFVVFTGVFWLATRFNKKVVITNKWATPLVGLVFAVLNTSLYWVLEHVLNIATLGAIAFVMPLVINVALVALTIRIFQARAWLTVDGLLATLWLALALTIAHGALWLGLDYLPTHV